MLAFSVPGFSAIEHLMKSILDFFHGTVGLPWAWSIVALTVLVRIVLVPLTVKQIHSMQSLQRHAPEMKALQQRYKGDRAKLNEELMKFYKENHINPAASCLPLVAQFPVFIALYLTLKHFSHHITGSWLHVVPDISAKTTSHWSGYILLAVYAGSQIASTYFMGTTMDKTQRNIMMVLPLAFITVVSRFPVGLVLYWMTTNLWTVGQGLVTRRLVPKAKPGAIATAPAGPKRSSRTPPRDAVAPNGTDAADAAAAGEAEAHRPAAPRETQEGRRPPVSDEVSVEATGETVGEAKWKALRDLERAAPGLDKTSVSFQVVSEGERGLLGVGYTPARVIASVDAAAAPPPRPARDETDIEVRVRTIVTRVADAIGVGAQVDVRESGDEVLVICTGGDLGLLIGKHGQTIDALQHVVNAALHRGGGDAKPVTVDAAGYRDRRRSTLESIALRGADRAARGERVLLEPMTAGERKVVHERLKDVAGVQTTSEGVEPNRYVVVLPA